MRGAKGMSDQIPGSSISSYLDSHGLENIEQNIFLLCSRVWGLMIKTNSFGKFYVESLAS